MSASSASCVASCTKSSGIKPTHGVRVVSCLSYIFTAAAKTRSHNTLCTSCIQLYRGYGVRNYSNYWLYCSLQAGLYASTCRPKSNVGRPRSVGKFYNCAFVEDCHLSVNYTAWLAYGNADLRAVAPVATTKILKSTIIPANATVICHKNSVTSVRFTVTHISVMLHKHLMSSLFKKSLRLSLRE